MPDRATHCPGCGIPITDCRVLFRERGEGETPEDFMREYARSSPYGHEQACRVVERLEAQFLESRSFQVSEVARMFGIPPHMLMDTEKSTSWGTGIEQQSIGWVVYTLRPWLSRLEQRITRLIKPQSVYARWSVEGLLRGDSAQRSAFYQALWGIGVLSTNEVRALEDMEPVEGGDVRYRPLNMGVLGTAEDADNPDPATPQEATSA